MEKRVVRVLGPFINTHLFLLLLVLKATFLFPNGQISFTSPQSLFFQFLPAPSSDFDTIQYLTQLSCHMSLPLKLISITFSRYFLAIPFQILSFLTLSTYLKFQPNVRIGYFINHSFDCLVFFCSFLTFIMRGLFIPKCWHLGGIKYVKFREQQW